MYAKLQKISSLFLALFLVAFTKVSDVKHASDAAYLFLQDGSGQKWVYKQIIEKSSDDQMVIVLETFASEIAAKLDLPINEAHLISDADEFPHAIFDHYPGSLHRVVPGESVETAAPWEEFDLHQRFRTPFMIKRHGPLNSEEIGLTREVVYNMAKHPDLPKIVAFDTYLGNIDRSNPNIFFDSNSGKFYGIDMGNSLLGNLAKLAYHNLLRMKEPPFSEEELQALQAYRKTLLDLIHAFPPSEMEAILLCHLQAGGFVPSNPQLWNEDAERQLNEWKHNIEETYQSSLQLVDLLKSYDSTY